MLRSCRFIIFAVAGLIFLAGAQQPSNQTEATKGGDQDTSAAPKAAPPAVAAEPSYRPYPDRYSDACYNSENYNRADLCAQWRAALAAEKAAREARIATIASIIATVLSAIGVGGLIYTLWQTHGALHEARRGNRLSMKANARATRQSIASGLQTAKALELAERNADAASEQVRIAGETAKHELRPYLYVAKVMPAKLDKATDRISIELKNFGKTPAVKVKAKIGTSRQETRKIRRRTIDFSDQDFTRDIPPEFSQTIHTRIEFPNWTESVEQIASGKIVLCVYLGFSYESLDGTEHDPIIETIIFDQNGPRQAQINDYANE